jgi:multidrug resistance protein
MLQKIRNSLDTSAQKSNPSLKKGQQLSVLALLAVVMLVNALSYGTIIPLLYPYAALFGIGPLELGVLFAAFSIAQFFATPIIGRLSDSYGRKPLLLLSLFGTSLSLLLFAIAWSAPVLFIARILDGITGGNMTVAQAIIADTYPPKERTKGFGILGAAFGFGFLFGPAIGGLLSLIHITAPFWFASALAAVSSIIGYFILPETLSAKNRARVSKEPLFNFSKLVKAVTLPVIGPLLILTFLTNTGQMILVMGFQTFSVDILQLNATELGLIFTCVGLVNLVMQGYGVHYLLKKGVSKNVMMMSSLVLVVLSLICLGFIHGLVLFVIVSLLYSLFFAPQMIVITQFISEKTNDEDQGGMLGINQSYGSIGQIAGPAIAGVVALLAGVSAVYFVAAGLFLIAIVVFQQGVAGVAVRSPSNTTAKFDL